MRSENDDTKPPMIEDLKMMDAEFDERLENDFKKLMRMRTYKARYKEILVSNLIFDSSLVPEIQGGGDAESPARRQNRSVH